jgi:hypothetical protein
MDCSAARDRDLQPETEPDDDLTLSDDNISQNPSTFRSL